MKKHKHIRDKIYMERERTMEKEKAIVNMYEWDLNYYYDQYFLSGRGDNHPRLGKNFRLGRTSSLIRHELKDDILIYETRNTIYHCPLKYVSRMDCLNLDEWTRGKLIERLNLLKEDNKAKTDNEELFRIMVVARGLDLDPDLSDEFTRHLLEVSSKGQEEIKAKNDAEKLRMMKAVENYEDALYIEIRRPREAEILAYNIEGHKGTMEGISSPKMFSQSLIYEYRNWSKVDDDFYFEFRYTVDDEGDGTMFPYGWSSNIKTVMVKNVGEESLKMEEEIIMPGETIEVKREMFAMLRIQSCFEEDDDRL